MRNPFRRKRQSGEAPDPPAPVEHADPVSSPGEAEAPAATSPEPAAPTPAEPTPADEAAEVRLAGQVLLDALEGHAPGSREHADATATYAFATAVELGEPRQRCELTREIARLHDVGKVYVSSALARRPREELLPKERAEVDSHHEQGRALLIGAGLAEEVADLVLHIRERFDGRGPGGLSGRAIPLPSRISRAACAYHEGTRSSQGAGWRGEPRELGLGRVRTLSGNELDPAVADALHRVLNRAAARAGA